MFYAIACTPLLKDKAASEIQKNKLLSYIRNIITYVREHKKRSQYILSSSPIEQNIKSHVIEPND